MAGLPGGFFSDRKSQFGSRYYGMENVVIYSGQKEYLTTIGYIFGAFGNFRVIWYIFPSFGTLYQEKSGNPAGWSNIWRTVFKRRRRIAAIRYFRKVATKFLSQKMILRILGPNF
jgi:hypothetical protein